MATLTLILCITGCGQKGALYLPDPGPQSVPAADAAPVTGNDSKPDSAQHKNTPPAGPDH